MVDLEGKINYIGGGRSINMENAINELIEGKKKVDPPKDPEALR